MAEIQNIRERAQSIKDATQIGENTADKVGGVLVDTVDAISAQANELATKANKTDVISSVSTLSAAIAKKADAASVNESITEINAELATKAEKTDLDKHENAYTGDYLAVKDFAEDESVSGLTGQERIAAIKTVANKWLDAIKFDIDTDVKYIGRCKLSLDGVNVECYNYVCSWADNIGVQQLTGAVRIGDDGKAEISTTQNVLFRTYQSGAWGAWQSYDAEQLADPTNRLGSIDTTELDAVKDDFYNIWWKAKRAVAYRLLYTQNTYTQCIGIALIWVDGSTTWLHEIVIGSFGKNDDGSPSWVGGSGLKVFRIFHRAYARGNSDWDAWQEVGGSGITGRVSNLETFCTNVTPVIQQAQSVVDDVAHLNETMGAYSERESITLTAKETDKAISADGVKVSKKGWAIAEFTAELGNEYLFKPGETDGSVCIFAECIDKQETRAIDYQYTYDESGRIATAAATYNGKTYTYAYTYSGSTAAITDQDGNAVTSLPSVYTTTIGGYAVLTKLNAGAELPKDGYCRFVSNFQVAAAIQVAVSYKVGAADLTVKVVRDGMTASMCTQLSKINRKVDETAAKVPKMWLEIAVKEEVTITVSGKKVTLEPFKVYKFDDPTTIATTAAFKLIYRLQFHFNDFAPLLAMTFGDNFGSLLTTTDEPLDVSMLDTSRMTSLYKAFCSYRPSKIIGIENLDVSNVTDMCFCFNSTAVETLDLRNWNTAKVRDFRNFCAGYFNGEKYVSVKRLYAQGWDFSSDVWGIGFYNNGPLTDLYVGEGWGKGQNKSGNCNLDFRDLTGWKNGIETLLELYDRKTNGLPDQALMLPSQVKTKLGEDGLATLAARGYIIS